jgi:hypothetical protein
MNKQVGSCKKTQHTHLLRTDKEMLEDIYLYLFVFGIKGFIVVGRLKIKKAKILFKRKRSGILMAE